MFQNSPKLLAAALTCAAVAALTMSAPVFAQEPESKTQEPEQKAQGRVPLPVHYNWDWSDRHVVFTGSTDMQKKIANASDPRFHRQVLRRNAPMVGLRGYQPPDSVPQFGGARTDSTEASTNAFGFGPPPTPSKKSPSKPTGDWNLSLSAGSVTAPIAPGQFPAKYSFDLNANPSCINDYLILGENTTGSAGAKASQTGTYTGDPTSGQTTTVNGQAFTATRTTTSTATLDVISSPNSATGTVTIDGVVYTMTTTNPLTTSGGNIKVFTASATGNIANNGQNLLAAITNNSTACSSVKDTNGRCFINVTAANAGVTSVTCNPCTSSVTTINMTSTTAGSAGTITATSTSTGITPTVVAGTTGSNTGTNFLIVGGSSVTNATNLVAAINRTVSINGTVVASNVGSTSATVTITATAAGTAGNSIALSDGQSNFTWNGATLTGGAAAQPSIVGMNNLYSGGATPATVVGVFTSSLTSGSVTIDNTANPGGLSKTFNGGQTAAASAQGTFTGCTTGCGTITIGSLVMTAAAGSTASGTASVNSLPGTSGSLKVTNGANILTITNAGTSASVNGTFTGGGAGNIVIGNVTFSPGTLTTQTVTYGTSRFTPTADGDSVTAGGTTYRLESGPSALNDVLRDTGQNGTGVAAVNAANLAAAINNDPSMCGSTATIHGVTGQCFWPTGAAANTNVAASVVTGGNVVTVANRTTSSVGLTESSASISVSATSIGASSATSCSATAGTFLAFANATQEAKGFTALIGTCPALSVGVTATSAAAVMTITTQVAAQVSISEGSGGFTWASGATSVGSNGATACTDTTTPSLAATFAANAFSTTTVATNIQAAINACLGTGTIASSMNLAAGQASSGTTVNFLANAAGTAGNSIALASTITGVTVSGATLTGGSGTAAGCSSPTAGVFNTDASATNMGANFVTALAGSSCATARSTQGIAAPTSSAGVITVTASATGASGNSISISETSTAFSWNGGAVKLSGGFPTGATTDFTVTGTASTDATNLAAAITSNISGLGLASAVAGSGLVTLTASANTGTFNGNSINVSEAIPNFIWNYGSLSGGTTITGECNATGPTVVWSYASASGNGVVSTSPILSQDGTKVAFIESVSGTGSFLRVIRMASAPVTGSPATDGTIESPTALATTNTGWGTGANQCPISGSTACMVSFKYTTRTNTNSAPYYDYSSDTVYVGDDNGSLWKITGIFSGTPSNAWASGVTVSAGSILTGPVLDLNTGNIFVGDSAGGMSYVRGNSSSVGSCAVPCLGTRNTTKFTSIVDPPIVDSSDGLVTYFGQSSSAGAQIVQYGIAASPLSGTPAGAAGIGSSTTNAVRTGAFNNDFFNTGTGVMYACGNNNSTNPYLYAVSIGNGAIESASILNFAGGGLGSTSGQCSPVSEVFNPNQGSGGGIDWIFVGVPGNCNQFSTFPVITTGCVMSFDVSSLLTSNSTPVAQGAGTGASVGSSGIIVDNVSTSGKASSIYYATQSAASCTTDLGGTNANSGCMIQRSQSGLK